MAESDIRLKEGVDRPIIEVSQTMVGLTVQDGVVLLSFKPIDSEQAHKLHDLLSDQINRGGVDILLAPMVAKGLVVKRERK